ncbi:hypothetical protein ABB37_01959 [Leptomonas pyrrhocoris]|uniref:Uncharacterized protein n=1 Tax=Leptomonas pyrrhocoris TaxID=157538 RepID=A0A0M9G6W8_LEPPY|nr:hypothetical protein ABB37_01959 [Leptomonas pyrrhocoris]XP_015662145.1 hypothetical protein ABB37_01959 [Leptomonas pyrrhocoris]XP_015662146.1 hypothetical protein ABB37_01959 [Leptomonas pyrrhocoris]KPA83705.1 hypothetical protein ABB37_01959 [Leptomonas pyrrhocoris]KPA83706.1 hypothetical protein ABB37_01959 [Leptomonas pyrrhocoris]KPA83707.1 hypothetical protein ABB37_01959 [Leptomonas pyrrhocoris]|eukprot:XP_015662144.1 hypothetical protein ABB37_01959 [Leptomonas pyrrhocoris]
MTQKLLLAEGLDLLRQCEQREYDVDRTKTRISSSSRYRNELGRLLQSYDVVYQQYVRGIQILNYVRHTALTDRNPRNAQYSKNLAEFCAGKMAAYMTRCDNIVKKTDHILLPIELVDQVTKEGYAPEDTVYLQDGATYPLSRKEKVLAKEFTVAAGTYVLALKNRDDYTLAAPDVDVTLVVLPQRGSGLEPSRVELKLPCQCGWRKVVGVVDAATLQLEIRFSGIRDAHVDVLLQKWCRSDEVGRGGAGGGAGLGAGPGPALSAATFDSANYDSADKSPSSAAGSPGRGIDTTHQTPLLSDNATYNNNQNGNGGQQPWMTQLPALPDDELATLASYNVPTATLPAVPRRNKGPGGAPSNPPSAAAEDPWAQLEAMRVPYAEADRGPTNAAAFTRVPEPVEVNPSGLTCRQRLDRIHGVMDVWPTSGVTACALPREDMRFVQTLYGLPMPRELSG